MSLTGSRIAARLRDQGVGVAADEAEMLARFAELLRHWNRVHNLTGIRDDNEFIDRHLLESLALEAFLAGDRIADIGSGGGLPGIPLAIRRPGSRFTLIESRRKRVSFLRHVVTTLGLTHVDIAHGRAEALDLPAFTTIVGRAVASPAELLSVVTPLLEPDGRLILLTGDEKGDEILRLAADFRPAAGTEALHAGRSRIVVLDRNLS